MEKSKDINKPIKPKEFIEEEQMTITQTVPLNSLLIYIVDGIIPLIITLCKQFAACSSSGLISEEYPILLTQRHDVLKSVGDSIGVSICSIILSGTRVIECPNKWCPIN